MKSVFDIVRPLSRCLLLLAMLAPATPSFAQKRVQQGIVRMITRSAEDKIVPVKGVQVVVDNVACKESDERGRFSLNVAVNKDGSYSLADVRLPKGSDLVWASPQKKKKLFLSKGDLDVAVATKADKDAEYKKRYDNLQQQYKSQVKRLKRLRDEKEDALLELQQTDARYAQVEAERDSIQKMFTDYITNKEKIDKVIEEIAEELSMVDYQSLDTLELRIYKLKCAGEWKSINDLVRETMGGDALTAFNRIKEKGDAAAAKTKQKKLELAEAMSEEQAVSVERERWFKMMEANIESFKAQHLNDSVSHYYELLVFADSTNVDYLNEAGKFEADYMADGDKALQYYQRELSLAESDSIAGKALNNIATVYEDKGDFQKALEYFQKALGKFKVSYGENSLEAAVAYNNIAVIYAITNEDDLAFKYLQKSLKMYKSILGEEHLYVAVNYIVLGEFYRVHAKDSLALECYQKALNIRTKLLGYDHPAVADCYIAMCKINTQLGNYSMSLELLKKADVIYKKVFGNEHPQNASVYMEMADVYAKQGKDSIALDYYQKAATIYRTVGRNYAEAYCFEKMGLLCLNTRKDSLAISYYQKVLPVYNKVYGENSENVAICYWNIGECYKKTSNIGLALEYLQKALNIYEEIDPEGKDAKELREYIENIKKEQNK